MYDMRLLSRMVQTRSRVSIVDGHDLERETKADLQSNLSLSLSFYWPSTVASAWSSQHVKRMMSSWLHNISFMYTRFNDGRIYRLANIKHRRRGHECWWIARGRIIYHPSSCSVCCLTHAWLIWLLWHHHEKITCQRGIPIFPTLDSVYTYPSRHS